MLDIVSLLSSLLGLTALIMSGLAWLRSAYRKEYAAEREFKHVQGDIRTLSQAIVGLQDRIDEQNRELIRLTSLSRASFDRESPRSP